MAIMAKEGGGSFKVVDAGGYAAVCDMMVDLGIQPAGPNSQYGPKHKVYLRFQIPSERVIDEQTGEDRGPAVTGITMTVSLANQSQMKPFLESWRGKAFTGEEIRGFDITSVAGAAAFINVIHEPKGDKVYANIASIMPIPKGMPKPTIDGEVIIHDSDTDNYDRLPKWLQDKIDGQLKDEPAPSGLGGGAPGGSTRPQPAMFDTDLDDDVPF